MTNELIGNDTEGGWASREGMRHYEEGNYKIAAALFSIAFEERIYTHALEYADICMRDLDGKNMHMQESAKWYLIAAREGDGDALSYLDSISEALSQKLSETPREHWVPNLVSDVVIEWISLHIVTASLITTDD